MIFGIGWCENLDNGSGGVMAYQEWLWWFWLHDAHAHNPSGGLGNSTCCAQS